MSSTKQVIYYVEAPAGAGKTEAAILYAVEKARAGERILIVQPTIDLIKYTHQKVRDLSKEYSIITTAIYSGANTSEKCVKHQFMDHLKSPVTYDGEILIVTHKTFFAIRFFPNSSEWQVIIDETPDVIRRTPIYLPETHDLLTAGIESEDIGDGYVRLKSKVSSDQPTLAHKSVRNKKRDSLLAGLKPFTQNIDSPSHDVFMSKVMWDKIGSRDFIRNGGYLENFTVLRPEILAPFKKTIIMGAKFRQSELYNVWRPSVLFHAFSEIEEHLQYRFHNNDNGPLEVKYISNKPCSIKELKKLVEGKTVLEHSIESAQGAMEGKEFLYTLNKRSPNAFGSSGIRLSGKPHGSNCYKDFDNIVCLAATNPTPSYCKFLKRYGMTGQDINNAWMYSYLYQAVMRTSLRVANCTRTREVIVFSKGLADSLAADFSNVKVSQLPGVHSEVIGVQQEWKAHSLVAYSKSDCERKREERNRKLWEATLAHHEKWRNRHASNNSLLTSVTKSDDYNSSSVFPLEIQFFSGTYDNVHEELQFVFETEDELHALLREMSVSDSPSKKDWALIAPSFFGDEPAKNGTDRRRAQSNVINCWAVILDIDEGEMTPKDLLAIFPDTKLCICNSYRGKGRFRAIFLLSMNIPKEAYKPIWNSVISKIEKCERQFVAKKDKTNDLRPLHGIDIGKKNPADLFYAPRKAQKGACESESFFIFQDGKPLDVKSLILHPIHQENIVDPPQAKNLPKRVLDPLELGLRIKRYIEIYQLVPPRTRRHDEFFKLGVRLCGLGLTLDEVEYWLIQADDDGSRQRDGDVKKVMDTLRKNMEEGTFAFRRYAKDIDFLDDQKLDNILLNMIDPENESAAA